MTFQEGTGFLKGGINEEPTIRRKSGEELDEVKINMGNNKRCSDLLLL
jgi:hypothetical protein